MIGNFLGFSASISFSIAIGRRIREIIVGVPAVIIWILIFYGKKEKNIENRNNYGHIGMRYARITNPESIIWFCRRR